MCIADMRQNIRRPAFLIWGNLPLYSYVSLFLFPLYYFTVVSVPAVVRRPKTYSKLQHGIKPYIQFRDSNHSRQKPLLDERPLWI
jgi:hypothetical protein